MSQVLLLSLPFFGLIFIGFAAGKARPMPIEGLNWLNFYIVYVSLPALFFELLSHTPIAELANGWFILGTTLATATAFGLSFLIAWKASHRRAAEAAIAGVGGGYANIGYMGPGLTLAALGPKASVPTALIFCFDSALIFILVPLLIALSGDDRRSLRTIVGEILGRIFLHPFFIATFIGMSAAATGWRPPEAIEKILTYLMQSAAPCALFALGVTVALRPVREVPRELPGILVVKLILHPALAWLVLASIGGLDPVWVKTAVLMASLPPALTAFVLAQQYDVYADRASTTILIGTLLAVVTVSLALLAISSGTMPTSFSGR